MANTKSTIEKIFDEALEEVIAGKALNNKTPSEIKTALDALIIKTLKDPENSNETVLRILPQLIELSTHPFIS